jgi:hypothetical protein
MSTFGITGTELNFQKYMIVSGKAWADKARDEGSDITLAFDNNNLLIGETFSLRYDAALAADFIRFELLGMQTSLLSKRQGHLS